MWFITTLCRLQQESQCETETSCKQSMADSLRECLKNVLPEEVHGSEEAKKALLELEFITTIVDTTSRIINEIRMVTIGELLPTNYQLQHRMKHLPAICQFHQTIRCLPSSCQMKERVLRHLLTFSQLPQRHLPSKL